MTRRKWHLISSIRLRSTGQHAFRSSRFVRLGISLNPCFITKHYPTVSSNRTLTHLEFAGATLSEFSAARQVYPTVLVVEVEPLKYRSTMGKQSTLGKFWELPKGTAPPPKQQADLRTMFAPKSNVKTEETEGSSSKRTKVREETDMKRKFPTN